MTFLLFDRDEQLVSTLKDLKEAIHTEEINGEDVLEISIPPQRQEIKKNYRIVFQDRYGYWKEFIIREITKTHGAEGMEIKLFCESSFYEMIGDFIEDKRSRETTANVALQKALEPTRWQVGIVDDLGIGSTNFYRISAKEAVQKVAEEWQGEIRTRVEVGGTKIIARYVDLFDKRGRDLGKRFTYTKDLDEIIKTVHSDEVITALYGYGKGEEVGEGYGRRIDFKELNNGKAYVEDLEALRIWGRNNPDGTKAHVFGKVEFDDCEDREELLELTKSKLKELSKPLVTYEAKVKDLKAFGFEHEGTELGDIARIIDKEFEPELRLTARVVRFKRDLLEPENNEILLGNFIPNIVEGMNSQDDYINNFRSKQGVWDRASTINEDGTINAKFLDDLVEELNEKMNSMGGYVYISEHGEGIITYNKPRDQNPTMAIQILGGAFRIANSKKPDGEWDWRTFGDGNGFVADVFIGGILKGGKVHFDLTNGTLLIGNSPDDYALYWDGKTLNIKGNVDISTNPTVHEIKEDIIKKKQALENDINNTSEELKNDINSTSKELKNDINNTNTELENIKMNTYTKYEIDSQFKIQDSKIASKVSGVAYDKDKENINLRFSEVTQTIDGVKLDVKDYKDGKLTGQTYNFDGRNFSIGGKSGDVAEHNNSRSRYYHSDGSYTQISNAGVRRYIAGSGKTYHYLIHVVAFTAGDSSGRWIQLPDEFKGKGFSVYCALADTLQNPEGTLSSALHRVVVTGTPGKKIDYANARVPITGYKLTVNLGKDYERSTSDVQGMLIAIY